MKLSKKGKSRIHEMIDCAFEAHPDDARGVQVLAKKYLTECDDFELEPDDFEGGCCQNGKDHVILTVEEAKEVLNCIDEAYYAPRELYNNIEKQIEQAEKNNG